jgi:hypothetical protein
VQSIRADKVLRGLRGMIAESKRWAALAAGAKIKAD